MKYVLSLCMVPMVDFVRIRELFPAHRHHWSAFQADGTLVAIGPMENPADGALGVFTTRESAERFAEADPFVTVGVVQTWAVGGWQEAILDSPDDSHPRLI
jgi:uncharacterized protein YciI